LIDGGFGKLELPGQVVGASVLQVSVTCAWLAPLLLIWPLASSRRRRSISDIASGTST